MTLVFTALREFRWKYRETLANFLRISVDNLHT
jgi:hypothetical protein